MFNALVKAGERTAELSRDRDNARVEVVLASNGLWVRGIGAYPRSDYRAEVHIAWREFSTNPAILDQAITTVHAKCQALLDLQSFQGKAR